jgi:hypothetical protein
VEKKLVKIKQNNADTEMTSHDEDSKNALLNNIPKNEDYDGYYEKLYEYLLNFTYTKFTTESKLITESNAYFGIF